MHARKLNIKQWLYEGHRMFKVADDFRVLRAEKYNFFFLLKVNELQLTIGKKWGSLLMIKHLEILA